MLENLMDANGAGLICETEADTVSTAIGTDYGHWSDTLRKSFDHERLAYNRRTNHEYRECKISYLSVLLSGTPAQVKPLIPSAENGLFSRQLFYCMPPIREWVDQFCESGIDYDRMFTLWGERWKCLLDALAAVVSGINLKLTEEQKEEFNVHFSRIFGRAGAAHGDPMKSAVARIAINICRIIGIVALMRSLEALLMATDGIGRTAAEKPADDLVNALKSCPGLLPSPTFRMRTCKMAWYLSSISPSTAMIFMPYCHSRNLCICIRVISCRSFRRATPCSRKRRRRHSWICCLSTSPVARPFKRVNGMEYLPTRSTRC